MAHVAAHYDSGLMDFAEVENAHQIVEITALTATEIERAIQSRILVWKTLLKGESDKWSSIAALVEVYRRAANSELAVTKLRLDWGNFPPVSNHSLVARLL
jgi:hypothetical protein